MGIAMEWWELILLLLYSIVGGSVFFGLVSLAFSRFFGGLQTTSSGASVFFSASSNIAVPLVIERQLELPNTKLMTEVKNNLRICTEPWTGELIPFHTHVWDTGQYELDELPANQQNDLRQVYPTIGLVNQMVHFSIKSNYRDQSLDDIYMKIRPIIAERLHRI